MAVANGNRVLVQYFIYIFKKRDKYTQLLQCHNIKHKNNYRSLTYMLEFKDLEGMTPFLMACKDNNEHLFRILFEQNCDIYA